MMGLLSQSSQTGGAAARRSVPRRRIGQYKRILQRDMRSNWILYLMVLPVIAYYILFCYVPMYGIVIAFKDFNMKADLNFFQNIAQSTWAGLKYFREFFNSYYFIRVIKNTVSISFLTLVFSFPAPIILALMINEVKQLRYKKLVQTVSYLPHFISLVVVCGMIRDFTSDTGFITMMVSGLTGAAPESMLNNPGLFYPIYVLSDIWQGIGWGSIVYLAALSGIDMELYEAAAIDGAGRWRKMFHITVPGLLPTITIMFILRMGSILNVGYEKIILLYNSLTKPVAEVISTFTYQKGMIDRNWSYSTAVGLFNSAINIFFLVGANWLSKRFNETSLW